MNKIGTTTTAANVERRGIYGILPDGLGSPPPPVAQCPSAGAQSQTCLGLSSNRCNLQLLEKNEFVFCMAARKYENRNFHSCLPAGFMQCALSSAD
jgi:hypothetical protein